MVKGTESAIDLTLVSQSQVLTTMSSDHYPLLISVGTVVTADVYEKEDNFLCMNQVMDDLTADITGAITDTAHQSIPRRLRGVSWLTNMQKLQLNVALST